MHDSMYLETICVSSLVALSSAPEVMWSIMASCYAFIMWLKSMPGTFTSNF